MKIQKKLLYGLAIVGGVIAIMYLTKGMRKGKMATGGGVPPAPVPNPVPAPAPVPVTPAAV